MIRDREQPGYTERGRTAAFLAMCVVIGCWAAPVRPGIVLGESMAPTFRTGQVFLASRLRERGSLHRGDVVLAEVDGTVYLKRVHAVGGETVWGLLSPGGSMARVLAPADVRQIQARHARWLPSDELLRYDVPADHVFVLGDARHDSYDSRHFGAVPVDAVRGKVVVSQVFRLWSPGAAGTGVAVAGAR